MRTHPKTLRFIRFITVTCTALVLAPPLAPAALATRPVGPQAFYLSLGDSMAFGLQFDRLFEMLEAGTYSPDAFDTGYSDVLAAHMERVRPDQQYVNLSCPGESTDSMINGGCFFTQPEPNGPGLALHANYEGSQLDSALSFLRAHAGEVGPITVSIGGVDAVDVMAGQCNFDAACIAQSDLLARFGTGLDRILGDLRAAAPSADIVLVTFYNPFSNEVEGSDRLWRRYYSDVERDAARRHEGVRVADIWELFRGPHLCERTFLCDSGDLHPNDDGYRRIGDRVFKLAG
ncbi:MAG TPA: SGNH/GDSL hydrolase family protein [Acidimicrobiales bacterium]|nr:SGNH/GDSL hydrolase family protein [Acidimicrobiales bacterium]